MLNKEAHVKDITFMTTLEGYVHWKLTGEKVLGVGEASGMFPVDMNIKNYDEKRMEQFEKLAAPYGYPWKLHEILPKVLLAGEEAGRLTKEGAKLLDTTGKLEAGIPFCPPEGDAGTGMVATNSVAKRTGNVSAGTSVFAMVVLEKELSKVYPEIDLVTTPTGNLVAMVHCNNCTSDLNAWVGIFNFRSHRHSGRYEPALWHPLQKSHGRGTQTAADCWHITIFPESISLDLKKAVLSLSAHRESRFNLANFMRVNLFTSLGALKTGMDILLKEEGVKLGQDPGPWRPFQDQRRGTEYPGGSY